jgi:hypothetical protein
LERYRRENMNMLVGVPSLRQQFISRRISSVNIRFEFESFELFEANKTIFMMSLSCGIYYMPISSSRIRFTDFVKPTSDFQGFA